MSLTLKEQAGELKLRTREFRVRQTQLTTPEHTAFKILLEHLAAAEALLAILEREKPH